MNLEKSARVKKVPQSNILLARGVLQRKCNCGQHMPSGGECTACSDKNLNQPLQLKSMLMNAKDLSQQKTNDMVVTAMQIPDPLKSGLEVLSGMDLSGIRVHNNSSKPAKVNALAYTQGQDIHLGPGQGHHLPHEGWHVVQQMQGRVQPTLQAHGVSINDDTALEQEANVMGVKALNVSGVKQATAVAIHPLLTPSHSITQRLVNYIVQSSQRTWLYSSPGANEAIPENFVELHANMRLMVDRGVDLELIDSRQEWIEVRGEMISSSELGMESSDTPAGIHTGWIMRDATNLAPATNTTTENLRVAQDLDDLLDTELIPAMLRWESGVRTQGQAYASAHQIFSDTLERASQQAKARADFYAAVLTAVSVGALGWIGDAALSAKSVTGILKSAGLRGSIEDALQTAVGEAIDIRQGGWFTQHVNRETHPLLYLNSALRALVDTKADLISNVGTSKMLIGRAVEPVDRADTLIKMYEWWSNAQLRHTPNVTQADQQPLAREFERGFWAQYIKEDLTRIAPLPYYEGWTLHTYYHPESAVETRLDELGISSEAGINEWDSWYEFTDTSGPRDIDSFIRAIGSTWTQRLYAWATSYTPTTFD